LTGDALGELRGPSKECATRGPSKAPGDGGVTLGEDPIFEERVRHWVRVMERGQPVPMPVVVKTADGRLVSLGMDDRARVEAAKRVGIEDVRCCVLKEEACTPEQLEGLAKDLDRRRVRDN
jgi:hypothetical protein